MKKIICVPVLTGAVLWAAPVVQLPEVIAYVDGKPIPASHIRQAWKNALSSMPDDISKNITDRLRRRLAEEAVWQHEIICMLNEENIRPDKKTAEKYITDILQGFSQEQAEKIRRSAGLFPDSSELMIKGAVHFYLKRKAPELIAVTRQEIENFYRRNQLRFRIPGRASVSIISTADPEQAEMARAALLQGKNFSDTAKQYSTLPPPEIPPQQIMEKSRSMRTGDVSPVISAKGAYHVFMIKKRTTGSFLPLEQAMPVIRMELGSEKEAAVLAMLLKKRLAERKIQYVK